MTVRTFLNLYKGKGYKPNIYLNNFDAKSAICSTQLGSEGLEPYMSWHVRQFDFSNKIYEKSLSLYISKGAEVNE